MDNRLREGWEEAFDPSTNHSYYFNRETGETSWTKPASDENQSWSPKKIVLSKELAAILIQKIWRAKKAREHLQALMHSLYKRIYDPDTQAYFYYNSDTGQSSWMTPRGLKTKPMTSPNVVHDTLQVELPPDWNQTIDETTKRVYYVNERTGKSSWTIPKWPSDEVLNSSLEDGLPIEYEMMAIKIQASWRGNRSRMELKSELDATIENGRTCYVHRVTKKRSNIALPVPPLRRQRLRLDDASSDRSFNLSKRRYPRSKAQIIVDAAEDAELDDIPVYDLNLSHLQTVKISSRVWNLDHLKKLVLSHNQLSYIPSGIQDLVGLTYLDLSYNKLTTLPVVLQTTQSLEHMNLSHNQITTFSPKLWKLRGLLTLDLSYNSMKKLPYIEGDLKLLKETSAWEVGIGLLTKLTILDLSHNFLIECPPLLDKCVSLVSLNLSYNKIESLVCEIGNLNALETLQVEHNALIELPESIGRMNKIHTLIVHHNHIKMLPSSIGNCSSLDHMDLTSNQLIQVPSTIQTLTSLRCLLLGNNPGMEYPNYLPSIPQLESIDLSHCQLPNLPTSSFAYTSTLPSLKSINLTRNELTEIPLDIELLSRVLSTVSFSFNAITFLPQRFYDCTMLQELDLSHNSLSQLPAGISKLAVLKALDISFNFLVQVPSDLTHLFHLETLEMQRNQIQVLPGRIGFLSRLTYWDVSENRLEFLPSTCHHLKELKYFSAASNLLAHRPPYFNDFKKLHLDLSNNPFEALEVSSQGLKDAVAQALHALERREYENAASLFSTLLFDIKIRPYEYMTPEGQRVREQASFYRGICRYKQITQAYEAIDRLNDEIAPLERLVREHNLIKISNPSFHSKEAIQLAQNRIEGIIASKANHRTSIASWKVEAKADLERALRYSIEPITTSYTLGSLYLKTNQIPEAIEIFSKSLIYFDEEIPQGTVPILLQRAIAYEALGQYEDAKEDLKMILDGNPFHEEAKMKLEALDLRKKKYHAGFDTEYHMRSFQLESNGTLHRLNDPMISKVKLNEIDSPIEFHGRCMSIQAEREMMKTMERKKREDERVQRNQTVLDLEQYRREIHENFAMEKEEEDQHEREAAIEFIRRQKQLELQRQENERAWMQYEETSQRWIESELERIRLEELAALEEARRKEEAKAEYKKRLARRGGLRQGGRKHPGGR